MTNPTIELLLKRRSVTAINMTGPGPGSDDIDLILRAGARVPDHGKLAPWRFVLLEGSARAEIGLAIADAFKRRYPDADEERVTFEAGRLTRAPVVICVVSSLKDTAKVPEWEQVLSAGAVCQNMLVAATALGLACQWLTEWYAYDDHVKAAIGLGDGERIAGFVHLGTAKEPPEERVRPDLDAIVSRWGE
jgi:nitroreductase